MDIALDRAHDVGADCLGTCLGEERTQDVEGTAHRLAGDEHLGHEVVAALESRADLLERGDERIEEDRLGGHPELEAGVRQLQHCWPVSGHGLVVEALEDIIRGHAAPAFPFFEWNPFFE